MARTGPGGLRLWLTNNPSVWVLIVLLPSLVAGTVLGLGHRGEVIDVPAWWLLATVSAAALEGVAAGWLLGKRVNVGQIAGIGAVASGIAIGGAASIAATGSLNDPGGFAWPEAAGAMSAILFVPLLIGAIVGRALSSSAGGDDEASQADEQPLGSEPPPFWPPPPGWKPTPTEADEHLQSPGRPADRTAAQHSPPSRSHRPRARA